MEYAPPWISVSPFLQNTPISDDLKDKFPITLELAILSLILAMVVALPLGVYSAVNQDRPGDYIARMITIAGVAIPNFWTAILLIFFLVLVFDWLPPLGYVNLWEDPLKNLQQLIFPAIALGFFNMAFLARLTRSAMLEVFREGLHPNSPRQGSLGAVGDCPSRPEECPSAGGHSLGWQFGFLISGSVIIENIFLVPGMGKLLLDSIFQRDYAITQAAVVVITFVVVALNLLTDLFYGWLDPRIRYH